MQFKKIGVFSHIRPDGDCIGAQIALCLWLEKNDYSAMAFNDDKIPQNLKWLTDYFPVVAPERELTDSCDAFIVVDGNADDRFGSYEKVQKDKKKPSFMIDHHPDPKPHFDLEISDENASSTCELVYQLYREHNIGQIDSSSARAMFTGILLDTGSLQFNNVSPETMQIASDLLERGNFRPNEVAEKIYYNRSVGELHLLGMAMRTIQLFENNQIAIMYVNSEMLEATGTSSEDCDGFVNFPLSIAGVKVAVLLKDVDENGIKMSLRSRSTVDVNSIARSFNGGGHKKAAGAMHKGPLDKAIDEVVKTGAQQLIQSDQQQIPT